MSQSYINDLFFGFSTGTINNSNRENTLLSFDQLVEVLNVPATDSYREISKRAISTLEAGGKLADVKAEIDVLKKSLHPVLFSGFILNGHGDVSGEFDYNGCVQVDIDFKEKGGYLRAQEAFDKIKNLPFILLAAISPSGVGVKALVSTTNEFKIRHKACSDQVNNNIAQSLDIDRKYFDTIGYASVCYQVQAGDLLYVNNNAVQFKYVHKEEVKEEGGGYAANKVTVNLTSTTEQVNARLKRGLDRVLKNNPDLNTIGIQSFAGFMSMWAIEFETGRDFLIANGFGSNLTDNSNKRMNSLRSMCNKNKNGSTWGKALTQVIEVAPVNKMSSSTPDLVINQYLSEVAEQLSVESGTLIVAPTGAGKTTWVKSLQTPRIMVVPTRVMVDQIASETDAVRFYGDDHSASIKDEFIVTTYASLPTLANKFEDIGLSRYTLFLDEVHVFTSNAASSFQLGSLRKTLEVIASNRWVSLTATPLFTFAKELEPKKTIQVTRSKNPTKTYQSVVCSGKIVDHALVNVGNSAANGKKSFLFFNNTQEDGQYGAVISGLEKLGLAYVSVNAPSAAQATATSNSVLTNVITNGDITGVDVVVATSLFKEGMSVTKGLSSEVDIHVIGSWHPMEIEQFSNRARGVETINAYLYKTKDSIDAANAAEQDPTAIPVNIETIRNRAHTHAVEVSEAFTKLAAVTELSISNIKHIAERIENADAIWFDVAEKKCVPDTLLLSNSVYRTECNIANSNNKFMQSWMSSYNWTRGVDVVVESIDQQMRDAIKVDLETAEEARAALYADRTEYIRKNKCIDDICNYNDDIKNGKVTVNLATAADAVDHALTVKLNQITRAFKLNTGSIDPVLKVAEYIGTHNAAISNMYDIVRMDKLLTGNDGFALNYQAYREIYDMYYTEWTINPNKVYATSEMVEQVIDFMVNEKYAPVFGNKVKKSASLAGREFARMFEVEHVTTSVIVEGEFTKTGKPKKKQVSGFKIIGPAIAPFYKMLGIDPIHNVKKPVEQIVEESVVSDVDLSTLSYQEQARHILNNIKRNSKVEPKVEVITTPVVSECSAKLRAMNSNLKRKALKEI